MYHIIVPTPTVSITVSTNQTAGQSLILYCNITAVRGITSKVNVTWLVDGSILEIVTIIIEMGIYMNSYTINQLSTNDDGKVYQCEILINSDPRVIAIDNFTLNVTGEYI